MSSLLQENRPHHVQSLFKKTNVITPNIPPLLHLPPLYILSVIPCGVEQPCGQFGSPIPPTSLSICHGPSVSSPAWPYKKREGLGSVYVLLSKNKSISILSTLFSAQTSTMDTMKKTNSTPAKTTTCIHTYIFLYSKNFKKLKLIKFLNRM